MLGAISAKLLTVEEQYPATTTKHIVAKPVIRPTQYNEWVNSKVCHDGLHYFNKGNSLVSNNDKDETIWAVMPMQTWLRTQRWTV